ncbi:MAG: L,D-transpeptidase family protein [Pseudomonadota bacterium]
MTLRIPALMSAILLSTPVWAQTAAPELTPVVNEQAALSPISQAIKKALEALPRKTAAQKKRATEISRWYEARNYEPHWVRGGKPTPAAERVTFTLFKANEEGLDPADYGAAKLFGKLDVAGPVKLGQFEVALADSAVQYGQHLHSGRVDPSKINRELMLYPDTLSADKMLDKLSEGGRSTTALAQLSPRTDRYARLKKHLLALRLRAADGGYTVIPEGEVIKPEGSDPRIPLIRQRLIESGDLPENLHTGETLDGKLLQALKYYQYRMGLEADGVIGPATLAQMNIPIAERITQVEINLERRRWMQADFGKRYIFVNLADQVLKVVDKEKTVHATIVQVGLPFHRTPVFSDQMEYVDFNPFWNVPYSIATKEYLPKLKRNPYALQSQKIRVLRGGSVVNPGAVPWSRYSRGNFPVRLRQDPGPKNALGRVKFMFPNKHNIYIHDTPSKSKFSRASRYFSHGCVRVQNPFELAKVVLGFQGVTEDQINGWAVSGKKKIVRLEQKLPVHIAYLTAWVNKDGSVHYRRDIYGRDKILRKALAKAS